MKTGQTKIDIIQRKISQLKQDLKKEFETELKNIVQEFFTNHPAVKSFSWAAYIPYFNDGDACYFNYSELFWHPAEVEVNGQIECDELDSIDWFSTTVEGKAAYKDLKEINKLLGQFEDELEDLFGSHQFVKATPQGFDVEEYEHE